MRLSFIALVTVLAVLLPVASSAQSLDRLEVRAAAGAVASTKRTALIIGNAAYQNVPKLQNPINDAEAMATKLQSLGFQVLLAENTSRQGLNRAIDQFVSTIDPGSEALVYYSGHGVELNGANYLLPVDIPRLEPEQERSLRTEGVNLTELLQDVQAHSARVTLVILDACRDNPFRASGSSSTRSLGSSRGLGAVEAPRGSFVIYSAGVGEQALDNLGGADRDPNGLFTRKLLGLLDAPGVELRSVVQQLRQQVRLAALDAGGHSQIPSYYDQLLGEFYFRPSDIKLQQTEQPSVKIIPPSNSINKNTYPSSTELSTSIQNELLQTGCYSGAITGKWDQLTRDAIERFSVNSGINVRNETPTLLMLEQIRVASRSGLCSITQSVAPAANPTTDSRTLTRLLRAELQRVGCLRDDTHHDEWDLRAQQAILSFNRRAKTSLDPVLASSDSLRAVSAQSSEVCPTLCGRGYSKSIDGSCVKSVAKAIPPRPSSVRSNVASGSGLYPRAISMAYANETPLRARMKTCLDFYNARSSGNGVGGHRWVEPGGGYWSN